MEKNVRNISLFIGLLFLVVGLASFVLSSPHEESENVIFDYQPGYMADEGCSVYSVALQNKNSHSLTDEQYNKLVAALFECMKKKGYSNIKQTGISSAGLSDLFACKTETMQSSFKIKESLVKHDIPNTSSSPFLKSCPLIGSSITILLRRPNTVGFHHAVTCEVKACNPATGTATLNCVEAPEQGGAANTLNIDGSGMISNPGGSYHGNFVPSWIQ